MKSDTKKVVLIGTGMVGMSFAYAALNQGVIDELVLIDVNKERAMGEAMDLNHGLAFAKSNMKIYAGEYSDCKNADIVVIAAGVAQKDGETRLDLLQRNVEVFRSIITPVVKSGFDGIFLVATNPVDIMTRVTYELSRFGASRVIGSGTTLDTARLHYLVGDYFNVDPRNVHGYVIAEHGDSEFVPFSQLKIGTKSVIELIEEKKGMYNMDELHAIEEQVRTAAYKIIAAKRATYYGIGMALTRIVKAILNDENSILTISGKLSGEYGAAGVFIGVPAIIGRNGLKEMIQLSLTDEEKEKFAKSVAVLDEYFSGLKLG